MIVIKVCSHSTEVTEYLTSFSTDIFLRLLKLNFFSVFTPNIPTSFLKFATLKLCWSMFWPIHSDIFHDFMSHNFDRTNHAPGAQPEIFQGRGGFVKLRHFDKHFVKNSRKKGPAGKILEFFLTDTLKTTFWMVNLN